MKKIVKEQKLGFVATVNEDQTPNLSPKGTCLVLDSEHIIFGEIRSPKTVNNIKQRPFVEINFVDQFSRKGFRATGVAELIKIGSKDFTILIPMFSQWGVLADRINRIVRIKVNQAQLISSPAYDIGLTEKDLRSEWRQYFLSMEEKEGN